jgi:zinc transport system permease protein
MSLFDYFNYPFFNYALIGILLIAVSAAMIGTYIISRRMVSICGGITHACFGGLGLGYFFGLNPIFMAAVFAVLSSVGVEWMSTHFRFREDSAIAVVWALGMAIGVLFVFLTPGFVPELNTFLFGNITTISLSDIIAFAVFTVVLAIFFALRFRTIVACAFDRDFAQVIGLPVKFITYAMTVLVAVCIVLTIRLVGVMLLMSMLSLPIITAEIFYTRFRSIMLCSIGISAASGILGIFIGAMVDVPCSAVIVLLMATVFVMGRVIKAVIDRRNHQSGD